MENAYHSLFITCLLILAVVLILYVIRTIIGPTLTDRINGANAIGTTTIVAISILAMLLNQSYVLDVCLIYAMLSFLAVVVLVKLYLNVYENKKGEEDDGD